MPPIPMPCAPKSEQGGFWDPKVSQQSPYGTCYAHSAANAVIEACTRRVRFLKSRHGQHHCKLLYVIPNHEELVEEMIENARKCGNKTPRYGGQMACALRYGASKYKLTVTRIGQAEAKRIVQEEERPVPASFFITQRQWAEYSQFYDTYKGDRSDWVMMNWNLPGLAKLSPSKYKPWQETGHSILLIAAGRGKDNKGQKCSHQVKDYWVFKNSWGSTHGHGGYDRVAFDAVRWSAFYDVQYEVSMGFQPQERKDDGSYSDGVNYSGKCENVKCDRYGKRVICRRGMGKIDAIRDYYLSKIVCPHCGTKFHCDVVYLSNCQCRMECIMSKESENFKWEKEEEYNPKGSNIVTLGEENGIDIFTYYSQLDFVCSKH